MDTTLPNIGDRYLNIELPWGRDINIRMEISERVREVLEAKWHAMSRIRELRNDIHSDSGQELPVAEHGEIT